MIAPVGMTVYLGAMTDGVSAEEEDDEHDEENERDAAAAVVAETRAHAVSAKAGAEDQEDEKNYKKHARLRSEREFCSGRMKGLRVGCGFGEGEEANTEILAFDFAQARMTARTDNGRSRFLRFPPQRASVHAGGLDRCGMTNKRMLNGRLEPCRALRDVIPPTPPGPEGSNGNGSLRAQ